MQARTEQGKAERLESIVALLREKIPAEQRGPVEAFTRAYFRQVDAEDLAERAPADLYGAALSHWNFARKREAGKPRVRVFNPSVQEHGWQSTHTIIEIVNDDMPFLVDSVTMEVNRQGLTLHLIVHPIMRVNRADGTLMGVLPDDSPTGSRESFMHLEVDRITDPARLEALAADLGRVLEDVRVAVEDWKKMLAKVREIVADLDRRPPPVGQVELAEARAFLEWLAADHFTFLGYRAHDLVVKDGDDALAVVPGSGLGILREQPGEALATSFSQLPPQVRAYARVKDLLIVTKANSRSTVHRPGYLDYFGIKRYDDRGEVVGEHRFLGLYTHMAYHVRPGEIPLLRRKVANVQTKAGLARRALVEVAREHHRQLPARRALPDLRGRARRDRDGDPPSRRAPALSPIRPPRPVRAVRHLLDLRAARELQHRAAQEVAGDPDEGVQRPVVGVRRLPVAIDARAHHDHGADDSRADPAGRRARARGAPRRRGAPLGGRPARGARRRGGRGARQRAVSPLRRRVPRRVPRGRPGAERGARLRDAGEGRCRRRAGAEPLQAAGSAARDAAVQAVPPGRPGDALRQPADARERMGLRVLEERPYRIQPESGAPVWMHDFGLATGDAEIEIDAVGAIFEEAFGRVFAGEVENDGFNRLVLAARVTADEIVVLRACAKYLRQIGFPLSQGFIEQTMAANPAIARMLANLFRLRFDPAKGDAEGATLQVNAIEQALDRVDNLNEDRVLRQYLALVLAMTRTNYWRRDADGRRRAFLSFKFDPSKVPGLPDPKPMFEIFVYSVRFEGVHLRGGKVARGGLRWSDRPEDFRTEVLGLVKAQMVKNVVIVPVGSKGGFVLKRAPAASDREAYMKEGVACYKDYLRGLLDVTDNLVGGKIVPPPQVRRHDPDDPYLVVAADKGTATFSDYANSISAEYGFWLGDAFASGGSAGYDHKAMGITARGAWESVKRHFREMGVDTQTTDFTVVGIGDMSGDVFGNGMLLSKHIRLVAAFDHRHVFIDPDPDAASSWAERKRLFDLPRSSWADYNSMLISHGGGVWPRSAKSIPLSPEARRALGIEAETLPPTELINAILKAPVQLLYNGGIGTYVKAAEESHA